METRLYLAAQKRAASRHKSFAAYVTDLIAVDLARLSDTEPALREIPAVADVLEQVESYQKNPVMRTLRKEMRDDAKAITDSMGKLSRSPRAAS